MDTDEVEDFRPTSFDPTQSGAQISFGHQQIFLFLPKATMSPNEHWRGNIFWCIIGGLLKCGFMGPLLSHWATLPPERYVSHTM